MVKICVPTMGWNGLDEKVSEHFGRAQTFTIIDLETGEVEVIPNVGRHAGGSFLPVEVLKGRGVDVLLCWNIGPRALNFLESIGVKVYYGASGTVREVLESFKAGRFSQAPAGRPPCPEHE